jgi:hypothetical protein
LISLLFDGDINNRPVFFAGLCCIDQDAAAGGGGGPGAGVWWGVADGGRTALLASCVGPVKFLESIIIFSISIKEQFFCPVLDILYTLSKLLLLMLLSSTLN